jgi:hypothetical protein
MAVLFEDCGVESYTQASNLNRDKQLKDFRVLPEFCNYFSAFGGALGVIGV